VQPAAHAILLVTTPGARLSVTIVPFSAVFQRRRGVPLSPPHDGNSAHPLANYLAHQPRCLAQMRQHQPIAVTWRRTGAGCAYTSAVRQLG
jgi:hypothetical protein